MLDGLVVIGFGVLAIIGRHVLASGASEWNRRIWGVPLDRDRYQRACVVIGVACVGLGLILVVKAGR